MKTESVTLTTLILRTLRSEGWSLRQEAVVQQLSVFGSDS